jgi:hypothetical protein
MQFLKVRFFGGQKSAFLALIRQKPGSQIQNHQSTAAPSLACADRHATRPVLPDDRTQRSISRAMAGPRDAPPRPSESIR